MHLLSVKGDDASVTVIAIAVAIPLPFSTHVICLIQICHAVKSQGYTPVRDPEGRIGPYAYKGNQWVSYDDVSDIRRKVRIIANYLVFISL